MPALRELKSMGVHLSIASSLSDAATSRFLEKHSLGGFFAGVWNRDDAGGIKSVPLVRALRNASLQPENAMFLTDTVEGIKVARSAGVHPDPDDERSGRSPAPGDAQPGGRRRFPARDTGLYPADRGAKLSRVTESLTTHTHRMYYRSCVGR